VDSSGRSTIWLWHQQARTIKTKGTRVWQGDRALLDDWRQRHSIGFLRHWFPHQL
jgi:hypothetical protein